MNPTTTLTIKTTTAVDHAQAIAVVSLAFISDPLQYFEQFPRYVQLLGGNAFTHNSAYFVEAHADAALWLAPGVRAYAGAALWLPPGVQSDSALVAMLEETVPPSMRDDLFALFAQLDGYHPAGPYWYLPLIGVDSSLQGKGYGSALLKQALLRCDADGLPAYLESSNPAIINLYQRHGFQVLDIVQVGSSPPFFPMPRKPR